MIDDTYNGWANRETWAVNMCITNDEGLYNDALYVVSTAVDDGRGVAAVADALKDWWDDVLELLRDLAPDTYEAIVQDCGSHWRVDWYDIAGDYMQTVTEGGGA